MKYFIGFILAFVLFQVYDVSNFLIEVWKQKIQLRLQQYALSLFPDGVPNGQQSNQIGFQMTQAVGDEVQFVVEEEE